MYALPLVYPCIIHKLAYVVWICQKSFEINKFQGSCEIQVIYKQEFQGQHKLTSFGVIIHISCSIVLKLQIEQVYVCQIVVLEINRQMLHGNLNHIYLQQRRFTNQILNYRIIREGIYIEQKLRLDVELCWIEIQTKQICNQEDIQLEFKIIELSWREYMLNICENIDSILSLLLTNVHQLYNVYSLSTCIICYTSKIGQGKAFYSVQMYIVQNNLKRCQQAFYFEYIGKQILFMCIENTLVSSLVSSIMKETQ
eukprot:TRINITY_DN8303_c0_g2_i6.p2 TRINITY_DN8303_c0_g2~~TRINITY_DN8303_c0_g2_i6.p2  ORF type:complete len:266 (+),score=-15.18 TRINITY_DN8303_c0_g2_i6:37-798(+)